MSENPSVDQIREEAAHWAVRLEDEAVTELECEDFRAWVTQPAHAEAFLAQVAIGALAGELASAPLKGALRVPPNDSITRSHLGPSSMARAPKRLRYAAIAATAALATIAAVWLLRESPLHSQQYVTATRELRIVTFEDGSTATMNTRSALRWVGNSRDRRVLLTRGEALFDVVPDRSRPFRVLIGEADEVRVLGTQFNVYRKQDGTVIVSVLGGNVEVVHRNSAAEILWSRRLSANQQIRYQGAGMPEIRYTDASKAVRWREGELEIEDGTLSDVITELDRYTDKRIVILPDSRLDLIHVGGVLSVDDIDSTLALLEKRVPIRVTRDPKTDSYTLAYRDERAPQSPTHPTSRP